MEITRFALEPPREDDGIRQAVIGGGLLLHVRLQRGVRLHVNAAGAAGHERLGIAGRCALRFLHQRNGNLDLQRAVKGEVKRVSQQECKCYGILRYSGAAHRR